MSSQNEISAACLCPSCSAQGLESMVFLDDQAAPPMPFTYAIAYTDPSGVYHRHEPGPVTFHLMCSRGHRFTLGERHECPSCGYVAPAG